MRPHNKYAVFMPWGGFEVAPELNTWDALEAGAELVLEGVVTFDPALHGTTVLLFAIADSCSGEEFMPAYCRVDESDETNNQSVRIAVNVP